MSSASSTERKTTRQDMVSATLVATAMIAVFSVYPAGLALRCTFVPGVIFAYCLYFVLLWLTGPSSGSRPEFAPVVFRFFLFNLCLQLFHFAEELTNGFPAQFPPVFGGPPFTVTLFVIFNLTAYVVFGVTGMLWLKQGRAAAAIPALFFVVFGTTGNVVTHLFLCSATSGYFPGVYTALPYAITGPWLLWLVTKNWLVTTIFLGVFIGCLLLALRYGVQASGPVI